MNINELRSEIDKIDGKIIELFEQRMNVSGEISEYKKANNLPLYDSQREKSLLASRVAMLKNDMFEPYAKQLFESLMELSKGYQFQSATEKNIVLIGIMGSGKTSNGKLLAKRLGMKFVDIDEALERQKDMTIPQIFEKYGKFKFREFESEKVTELSKLKRHVISTGGGIVLSDSNMEKLKTNGIVVFLNRDIDDIVKTIDTSKRPLLADGAQLLYEMYKDRLPLYKKWCDFELCESSSVESAVDEIINKLF